MSADTVFLYDASGFDLLPVPEPTVRGWIDQGVTRVRIHFLMDLDSIIEAQGMEDWNEVVDEVTGVSLTDLSYGFAKPDPDDPLIDTVTVLYVEGDLDYGMYPEEE